MIELLAHHFADFILGDKFYCSISDSYKLYANDVIENAKKKAYLYCLLCNNYENSLLQSSTWFTICNKAIIM